MITLFPFGDVDLKIIALLFDPLRRTFNDDVDIGDVLPLPERAYDNKRKQYLASSLIELLPPSSNPSSLGQSLDVTDEDIYAPDLNFVFGVANPSSSRAVISLKRLHESFYGKPENQALFEERMIKEAVHELGHTYGFSHCPDPTCVMHFSNSIADTDRKSIQFCHACNKKILA